jgi:hypothetical protein
MPLLPSSSGMDSLLSIRLRNFIVHLLEKAHPSSPPTVSKNVVYDYPSIGALVDFIASKLSIEGATCPEEDIKSQVRRSVDRFTAGLAPRNIQCDTAKYDDGFEYVVVTGTTGSLGSFVLDQLIDRPSVKRIYCFNRKTNSNTTERQLAGFEDRGLDSSKLEKLLGERVFLYDVDLSQPSFGLTTRDYEEVRYPPITIGGLSNIPADTYARNAHHPCGLATQLQSSPRRIRTCSRSWCSSPRRPCTLFPASQVSSLLILFKYLECVLLRWGWAYSRGAI